MQCLVQGNDNNRHVIDLLMFFALLLFSLPSSVHHILGYRSYRIGALLHLLVDDIDDVIIPSLEGIIHPIREQNDEGVVTLVQSFMVDCYLALIESLRTQI